MIKIEESKNINKEILLILEKNKSDYIVEYINIINKALSEQRFKLDKTDKNYIYYESHHILPKSLYPEFKNCKDNIVLLNAIEHFECHKLLTKIFPTPEMTFAYLLMTRYHKISHKEYERLKSEFAASISKKMSGVPKSNIHRKHISESRMGLSYGKMSNEQKCKISRALKGRVPSELNRTICSNRCKSRVGDKNTQSRKVRCIEDDLVFNTIHECEEYYNILHLYRYCSTGKLHTKINKHFEYIVED